MSATRALLFLLCAAAAAQAGTVYSFEPPQYVGAAGTTSPLAGQNGWITPSGSNPGYVITYAGTPIAVDNGAQFAAMVGGNTRAQHGASFSGSRGWQVSFDMLLYNMNSGNLSGTGSFILLASNLGQFSVRANGFWDSAAPNSAWSMKFDAYNASGVPQFGLDAGAQFHGLANNTWYHGAMRLDASRNRIESVSLNGVSSSAGWYLNGGATTLTANAIRCIPAATPRDSTRFISTPCPSHRRGRSRCAARSPCWASRGDGVNGACESSPRCCRRRRHSPWTRRSASLSIRRTPTALRSSRAAITG